MAHAPAGIVPQTAHNAKCDAGTKQLSGTLLFFDSNVSRMEDRQIGDLLKIVFLVERQNVSYTVVMMTL
jgi:hypothetical protein